MLSIQLKAPGEKVFCKVRKGWEMMVPAKVSSILNRGSQVLAH